MDLSDPAQLRQKALSRWDNEGGASLQGPQEGSTEGGAAPEPAPEVTNSEIVLLRVRLIAMENLLIALLADASERQLELAREVTAYISPRPGFTHHPLTLRAASHMSDLVERAGAFRSRTDLPAGGALGDRHIDGGPAVSERDDNCPAPGPHPDDQ
ncbi:hypothetical protein JKL49_05075 [Phenylobacterium sp. 20VBR1]|uniref:Uncharacterized protein n=1 Tax=Phenylobacterium glaciei TaxID=2803784 RepID=A0A941CY39_9CAUL|nr:hypothetical protein [Phenylobacterium glaciei]MBR7618755.1 hypothetical protein [Phenylobacterium glaciei]